MLFTCNDAVGRGFSFGKLQHAHLEVAQLDLSEHLPLDEDERLVDTVEALDVQPEVERLHVTTMT